MFVPFRLFLAVALLSLMACTKDDDDDSSPDTCDVIGLNSRILNGTVCELNFSPVVTVSIRTGSGVATCSGVMLTPNAVLTAGHCLFGTIQSIEVTGGPSGAAAQTSLASRFSIPPRIGANRTGEDIFINDVGIVFLQRNLGLPTIPILASEPVEPDDRLSIFGYGKNDDGDIGVLTSGEVEVTSVTFDTIFSRFSGGSSNTCTGDSGGPALLTVSRGNGGARTGVVGLSSTGSVRNCSSGDKTAFTNVQSSSVLDFIRSQVGSVRIE